MKRERGFTLIELLVVIAILGVLFGLTALALNGLGGDAEDSAKAAEKDMVQTAMDVYMAVEKVDTITAHTGTGKTSMQVGPGTTSTDDDEFATYLRRLTRYYYCWDANGNITQQDTEATACP